MWVPFNIFDVTQYGNAKQGPSRGPKIAIPSERKGFAKDLSFIHTFIHSVSHSYEAAVATRGPPNSAKRQLIVTLSLWPHLCGLSWT